MKGIILAGGHGSRLYPITKSVSKQLLCVYDKPMIYYPFSTLIKAGISEILIISTPKDLNLYKNLFGSGKDYGISIEYIEQTKPYGIAHSLILGKKFLGSDDVCLILGDNIFYGYGLEKNLIKAREQLSISNKGTIFGYYVNNPKRYGVLSFKNNRAVSIIEKPKFPQSNYAVTGIYFYPNHVTKIVENIKPSKRGELEITSVNNHLLKRNFLNVEILGRGFTWLDTGTPDSLLEASNFIQAIEKRQGLKVACIEEILFKKGFIDLQMFKKIIEPMKTSEYGKYLNKILNEHSKK